MSPTPLGIATGRMDRTITIKTGIPSQDDTGEIVYDWDSLDAIVNAEWVAGATTESGRTQGPASYIDGSYRIHYRAELSPENTRIFDWYTGRLYDVRPSVEIGRGAGWIVPVVAHGEVP